VDELKQTSKLFFLLLLKSMAKNEDYESHCCDATTTSSSSRRDVAEKKSQGITIFRECTGPATNTKKYTENIQISVSEVIDSKTRGSAPHPILSYFAAERGLVVNVMQAPSSSQ
jgi:hypothetical protein